MANREDRVEIRRVTIELGTAYGVTTVIELFPRADVAVIRRNAPTGEPLACERTTLERLEREVRQIREIRLRV